MLDALAHLLRPKLCRHNWLRPSADHMQSCVANDIHLIPANE